MSVVDKAPPKSDVEGARAEPSISLPKGGGAIRGIGEKFAANPVTGTGSMSVPIATSPGRSGFGPQLSLSYDSGAGNGPFGFGWSLALPQISRKTDKGLPQYDDARDSDVFLLSGAEDLVPVFMADSRGNFVRGENNSYIFQELEQDGYRIRRYRPRIEGMFSLIERWICLADGDTHWRSISKDNILTLYGKDANSRIADPQKPDCIFAWLISESRDDKGNGIIYEYKSENGVGLNLKHANERNRGDEEDIRRTANRYLKRIHYGNRVSLLGSDGERPKFVPTSSLQKAGWMFEVVFDYGEHDPKVPQPSDDPARSSSIAWPVRSDRFSSYRQGFEVRTCRLCQRVLMYHHFPTEPNIGVDCLVRSTDFQYSYEIDPFDAKAPVYSFLLAVTQSSYVRDGFDGFYRKAMPPLEFKYSQAVVQKTGNGVDAESLRNLPVGVDGATFQLVDLHGEGVVGILTEQGGQLFRKPNLSPIGTGEVCFGTLERVALHPNIPLRDGQFIGLAGDGRLAFVILDRPSPGFFEHDDDEGWRQFRQFISQLNVDMRDPNLRFADMNGDGNADAVITKMNEIVWYPSLAEKGFGPARQVPQPFDEEKGPCLVFADGTHSVYLADMSGDGLIDFVRIRNGEVCYWPNLGYGRFGAKVSMDSAPLFDNPDQFDQKRIRLADIDGSGTTDLIYLHRDGVRLYFNQCGNSWSTEQRLSCFPRNDELASIMTADLLGNGTACLVWSSQSTANSRQPMSYLKLMGDQKPHLLISTRNNLGAETHIEYATSTKFYLQDKLDGKPWLTRLAFPVHVVERVKIYDRISRNRFVTKYTYHHGYFDGMEREFRGFGMVEQEDTEEYDVAANESVVPSASNVDQASHVPPALTRTWFHTGAWFEGAIMSRQFEREYYREGDLSQREGLLGDDELAAMLLPDTVLPENLSADEAREACRSLKGSILRQEVYALDRRPDGTLSEESDRPYTVSERNYTIRPIQPHGQNRHALFFTHARETVDFHYERKLYEQAGAMRADPRVTHSVTLAVDDYGNPLDSVAIAYGRRIDDPDPILTEDDRAKQREPQLTFTTNRYTHAVDWGGAYRAPLTADARTFELCNIRPVRNRTRMTNLFRFTDLKTKVAAASDGQHDLPYEDWAHVHAFADSPCRRLLEHVRTLYRPDDLGAAQGNAQSLLPLGTVGKLAIPGETYKLAFTPGLLTSIYQRPTRDGAAEALIPDARVLLGHDGGYIASDTLRADNRFPFDDADLRWTTSDTDGHWWIPSGRAFFSPDIADDPTSEASHARSHFFLPHRFQDPFANVSVAAYDSDDLNSEGNHNLFVVETRDPLDNTVQAEVDYRVLQPRRVTDPNGLVTEACFDVLGLVSATAVYKGREGDSLNGVSADLPVAEIEAFAEDPKAQANALLGKATTRIVYDVERFWLTDDPNQPPYTVVIAREIHVSDLSNDASSPAQVGFSYSDGFGREIQKKAQAEPARLADGLPTTTPRWVTSGWTIFNNKGKPVRQFEPFFSDTHGFEFARQEGVSKRLIYDPVERAIATLHPNHTYEKVVFDPWRQATWDLNDTVLQANPAQDPDVGSHLQKLAVHEYLPTWHTLRTDSALALVEWPGSEPDSVRRRTEEKSAAQRAAAHAGTPSDAIFDVLGRNFLTIADNGMDAYGVAQRYCTRSELDIEGNVRSINDALGRDIMRYAYDLLGKRIHQNSVDAGARWTLNDVTGKKLHAWDSRGHTFRTEYDALRRPVRWFVQGADENDTRRDILYERVVYGEQHPEARKLNLRGKILLQLDGAGAISHCARNPVSILPDTDEAYDFKGNPLRSTRRLLKHGLAATSDWIDVDAVVPADGKAIIDLEDLEKALGNSLEEESFVSAIRYDALNRHIQSIAPYSDRKGQAVPVAMNVSRPAYNEAGLLERLDVWLEQPVEPTGLLDPTTADTHGIAGIDYDAKGQRQRIDYKNRVWTLYSYDDRTFRLNRLLTQRPLSFGADRNILQDLNYAYDPIGNITSIRDQAQHRVFHDNECIDGSNEYRYDPIYRLIAAKGREHKGQDLQVDWDDAPRCNQPLPNDGQALQNYVEMYRYDAVGNILHMAHHRGGHVDWPGAVIWKRRYQYLRGSNRLLSTSLPADIDAPEYADAPGYSHRYNHDAHGNMVQMPHLRQGEAGAPPSQNMYWDFKDHLLRVELGGGGSAWYVYDASGQRVRKIWQKADGLTEERIYLGDSEVFRTRSGVDDAVQMERETLHLMDDKQRIAMIEIRTDGPWIADRAPRLLVRYQLGNHLGSVSVEVEQDARVMSYEEYYPYGTTAYHSARINTETPKRYRYSGKERDDENGLCYYGSRYLAPWLGRWCGCDPEGLVDGSVMFAFTRNNPIVFLEKTGEKSVSTNKDSATPVTGAPAPEMIRTDQGIRITLFFGRDLFLLNKENYQALLSIRNVIGENKGDFSGITIEGHTSTEGSDKHNLELSQKRVAGAVNLLGLDQYDGRINQQAFGEKKPSVEEHGKTEAEREMRRSSNRKVDIYLLRNEVRPNREDEVDLVPDKLKSPPNEMNFDEKSKMIQSMGIKEYRNPNQSIQEVMNRVFDLIYDPSIGVLEKKLMESRIGEILEEFGVNSLKEPLRNKLFNELYNKIDDQINKLNVSDECKEALRKGYRAVLKQTPEETNNSPK